MLSASLLVPVLVGVLVGLLMGSLGGGGAIIAVPALIYLVGQSPLEASTTSLMVVGLTSVVGVLQHGRAGRVAWGEGMVFGLLGAAGAAGGSVASQRVPEAVLMTAFGLLLLFVARTMWRRARSGARRADADDLEAVPPLLTLRPFRVDPSRVLPVLLAASAVGFLTGFFGVGGGFAVVPALTLVLGLPMRRAVGTSLLVMILSATVALGVRAGSGLQLDWPLTLTFAGVAMAASLVGGRIGQAVPAHRLQSAFALLLVAVAALTLVQTALG